MEKSQRVLVAFQGGGARGIAHIGALQALEEWALAEDDPEADAAPRPQIVGVAGTSAGAIIAALVAAGYSANELFDPEKKEHLLMGAAAGAYAAPKNLFSKAGWRRIARIRGLASRTNVRKPWLKRAVAAFLVVLLVWWVSPVWPIPIEIKAIIGLLALLAAVKIREYLKGLANLDEVRKVIDEVIAAKVSSPDSAQNITFAQFASAGGLPLKIVSTNITKRTVEIFSAEYTPDVVVADAVCASICLPFIFPPYRMNMSDGEVKVSNEFVDGGVLSNLPLWSFDEERASDANAWTIGFSLARPPLSGPAGGRRGHWIGPMIDAIVSGPSQIHARAMPGLMVVPIPTSLKLLDFDSSFDRYAKDIAEAKKSCLDAMVEGAAEPIVQSLLERLQATLVQHFLDLQVREHDVLPGDVVEEELAFRFALAIQKPANPTLLTPRFHCGFDKEDLSERLRPLAGPQRQQGRWVNTELPLALQRAMGGPFSPESENWLVADSLWLMAFELPSALEAGRDSLAPVLLIDSTTLTIDRLVTTLGSDANSGLSGLVEVIEQVVQAFDIKTSLGRSAVRAQLWK